MFYEKRPEACNFIIKETPPQVFSCEFCKASKNTFLQNTSGRLLLCFRTSSGTAKAIATFKETGNYKIPQAVGAIWAPGTDFS